MVHLALPSLAERHHWLEEGLATYVEPIARARAGILTPERVWRDFIDGLPQGQPESPDRGLDGTPTWGRTYWGGALFCLRPDVTIRQRTDNRMGLEHCLRAILDAKPR
jgi:predicted metalloprotease with PDZ domain